MVPYVTGKFLGCDVTMDDDQIVKEAQNALQSVGLDNDDRLEDYDTRPLAQVNGVSNINQETQNDEPLMIKNAFQTLASLDKDLSLQTLMEGSPSRRG